MDKEKALEAALAQIEKSFGKGSVMKLGQKGGIEGIEAISTGSIGLDMALGVGGFPRGRIIDTYYDQLKEKDIKWLDDAPDIQGGNRIGAAGNYNDAYGLVNSEAIMGEDGVFVDEESGVGFLLAE